MMRYLSVSDRKDAALVCRTWYEASLDPILQRDIIIHFYASSAESSGKVIPNLFKRRLPHLVLNDFDSSLNAKAVVLKSCEAFGTNLKSLSLKGSNLTERTFVELLAHCKNLRSLDLSCCNSLFMAGTLLEKNSDLQVLKKSLSNVLDVNLSSIRHITDVTFNRIMTVCENIEKVSLASAQVTFASNLYYPNKGSRFASNAVFTFQNIIDFIITQNGLKALNLSKTELEDEHIEELVSTPGLVLQELILIGCRNISDDGIKQVCKHQRGLRSLDIGDCAELTNTSPMVISASLGQLRNLYMNKCKQITDKAIGTLAELGMLEMLDVSDCHNVSSAGLIHGLCEAQMTSQLTHLNVSCTDAGDEFVETASVMLPCLNHLDLGSCFKVSDLSVHAVSKNLKYLRYLRLAWCNAITDFGLLGLLSVAGNAPDEKNKGMQYASTAIRKGLTDTKLSDKQPEGEKTKLGVNPNYKPIPLSNLVGLRFLDLTACKKLTDAGLMQTVKFRELKHLSMGMIPELSDDGLVHIVYNNPSVEDLNVSHCRNITDVSMETVTRQLPRLQSLNVMGCELLTDKSVAYMRKNCTRLRHLDVSFCGGITHYAIDQLENTLSNPVSIQKRMIECE